MNRKRSAVWMHYTIIENERAKCNVCRETFSYKGGATSNLRNHLKNKHPTIVLEDKAASGPSESSRIVNPALEGEVQVTQNSENIVRRPFYRPSAVAPVLIRPTQAKLVGFINRPMTLEKQKKQNILLLKMIVQDLQPFSIVEDVGFIAYTAGLDPTYVMPSRTTLSKSLLPQLYGDAMAKVRQTIENEAEYVTLTTDCWTSTCTEGYMAVTAHFISKNWVLKSMLLECFKLGERHTSENLRNELIRVAQDWGISRKIQAVVSDNTANIVRAVMLTGWNHLGCMAHKLNLVVQSAVLKIKPLQTKIKSIVEHFHRSTVAAEKLKEMQKNMKPEKEPLKLIMDVATRWNSTYYMIERVCCIQEPIEAAIAVLHAGLPTIEADEWLQLKSYCSILKPMLQVTEELSAEKNLSASKVIIMIHGLMKTLKNLQTISTGTAKELAEALLTDLTNRFTGLEANDVLAPATYLDPRFKKNGFDDRR